MSSHQPIDMKLFFFDILYVFLLRKHRYICTYIISTNRYKVVFGTFFNRLCVFLLRKHSPRQSESCSDLAKNQHKLEVLGHLVHTCDRSGVTGDTFSVIFGPTCQCSPNNFRIGQPNQTLASSSSKLPCLD